MSQQTVVFQCGPKPPNRIIVCDNDRQPQLSLNLELTKLNPFDSVGQTWVTDSVILRAKDIVGHLSLQRIQELVMFAEWCVQMDMSHTGVDPAKYTAKNPLIDPLPTVLVNRLDGFDLTQPSDFSDVTWPEVFAALALAYAARSLLARMIGRESVASDLAATDAISIAERLSQQLQDARERSRRNGKLGGQTRNKNRFAEFRKAAIELGRSGRHKTFKSVAAAFCTSGYEWEAAGLKEPLSDDTVARWVSADPEAHRAIKGQ